MNLAIESLKESIIKSNNIILVGHINADGDTVSSVLGLTLLLKKLNKNAFAIFPEKIPDFLKWLPGYNDSLIYSTDKQKVVNIINQSDLLICLDLNEKKRIGELAKFIDNKPITKAIIDHHPYPEDYFDIIISEIEVSSTAELLFSVIEKWNFTNLIDSNIATCIFTGILTDTLCFQVNAHRAMTYEIVSKLINYGVDKNLVHNNVFNSYTENRMRLVGYALHKKLKVINKYSTAYIYLSKEELESFNFQIGDSEGLVNYPLSIKGIKLSGLFLEKQGYIKISLRSIGDMPVNELLKKHFVGGGHKNAAGGEAYNMTMEETLQKFENILDEYKQFLQ